MSTIHVTDVGEKLSHAELMLAGIEGSSEKAVKSAMARATSWVRTNSAKEIRKVYAISAESLQTEKNVRTVYKYTPGEGLTASITFMGAKIPLYRYDGAYPVRPTPDTSKLVPALIQGQWKKVHPGIPAKGRQLRASAPAPIGHAFVAQRSSGYTGIFERKGDTIKEIMGSAVPQMLGNREVEEQLATGAMEKFEERLDHEVEAILNGWR